MDARPPDAVDASRRCSVPRSATLIVVVNVDSLNDYAPVRETLVLDLVSRLLDGDLDADGVADARPLERVRLGVVSNEMFDDRFTMFGCGELARGELISSTCGAGGNMQTIVATDSAWRTEASCRLQDHRGDAATCVGEPLEAALVALSPDPAPIDLSPRAPLGDGVNRAWRDVDDVLVVAFQASDARDDCSRRIEEVGFLSGTCPEDNRYCCDANLPPVTRTSDALRTIVGDRPAVYASFGAHGPFDPTVDAAARLDTLERMPECFLARPHTRMVRLAANLHPDMHLLPTTCPDDEARAAGLTGLSRDVLSRVCD